MHADRQATRPPRSTHIPDKDHVFDKRKSLVRKASRPPHPQPRVPDPFLGRNPITQLCAQRGPPNQNKLRERKHNVGEAPERMFQDTHAMQTERA